MQVWGEIFTTKIVSSNTCKMRLHNWFVTNPTPTPPTNIRARKYMKLNFSLPSDMKRKLLQRQKRRRR